MNECYIRKTRTIIMVYEYVQYVMYGCTVRCSYVCLCTVYVRVMYEYVRYVMHGYVRSVRKGGGSNSHKIFFLGWNFYLEA